MEKTASIDEDITLTSESTNKISIKKPRNVFNRFIDSFKPPTNIHDFDNLSVQERALVMLEMHAPKLSGRHLKIIAASGSVGTGVFIGSGASLRMGGPGSLILGFVIMAVNQLLVMFSIGELASMYPMISPFYELPGKFLHESFGFAVGWMYALAWLIVNPIEIIGAARSTQYWKYDDNAAARANPVAWVSIMFFVSVVINLCGTRAYAETELIVGLIKIFAMIGFMIYSLINTCGGPPMNEYIGGLNYHNPEPFLNGFKGFSSVLVSCALSYGGTEISAIAAADTKNPIRAVPTCVKHVFWRILLFFIASMIFVSLLVAPTVPGLGDNSRGTGSPFVLALEVTGVRALPSIFNAVILMTLFTASITSIYAATRTLTAMAIKGGAPKFLCYVDRRGRPLYSLIVALIFSALSFVCASDEYGEVFDWLYAFAALVFFFGWTAIALAQLRFRRAMQVQGRPLTELLYKSPVGIWGAFVVLFITLGSFGLQFWVSLYPLGNGGKVDIEYFFQNDLSLVFLVIAFVGHKIYFWRTAKYVTCADMDLDAGIRDIDWDELRTIQEKENQVRTKNWWNRIVYFLC